jgi:hypothetical protein
MIPARAHFTLDRSEVAVTGALPQFHTVPAPGRYPSTIILPDGEESHGLLVIDDLAVAQIQARFQEESQKPAFAGLLVDREHLSELPAGDSTAAAWVKTMARRPDGLWTGWELTDLGEQLIPTKRFKFRSPVFDLEKVAGTKDEWRPVRLVSVALTNVPHFKQLAPSLNRESAAQGGSTMGLIDKLRALFGKPEAQEDELFALVDAALKAGETAKTEVATAQARVSALEKADLDRQADAFVSEHEAKVSDKAKLRARFIADPTGTRESFAMLKIVEAKPARQLGREGAGNPGDRAASTTDSKNVVADRKAAIAAVRARDNCTHTQATTRAQRENPALWPRE